MELKLYATADVENVIHKNIVFKDSIDFTAKNDLNMVSPILRLRFSDINLLFSSNYAEIPEFERFYFIREIDNISADVWRLTLECDVLESYKNDILNSVVNVTRTIKKGDYIESNIITDVRKKIDIVKSNRTMQNESKMILSTIGG